MEEEFKKELETIKTTEKAINKNLFLICAGVTFLAIFLYLVEFFTKEKFPSPNIGFFYLGVLLIYSFHKELVRWLGEKGFERQGEWFVYLWIGVTTALYLINFFTKNAFSQSTLKEITITCLEVFTIFIITRFSKIYRAIRKRNQT